MLFTLAASTLSDVRILVVDDHAQNRYFLECLFAANGHECVSAGNGSLALEALRSSHFDAIVSDVLMPEMDGFQLCRETRRDEALRETPFIFYTATYTDSADRDFGLSLGASAYVVKPAEPQDILEAVSRASLAAARTPTLVESDSEFHQAYNPRLVRKLEQKVLELEGAQRALLRSNDALRDEVRRRKEAESKLSESLALFESTVASTADGICACDLQGKVIALNAQFLSVWCLGASDTPWNFKDLRVQLRAKLQRTELFDELLVLGEELEPAEGVLQLRDGSELELRRRPLRLQGKLVGQVWSCTNTTERRLAELRELELQRRLWDAQKLTDLGLLAAGIAHDFNNLLTVVRGSTETASVMVGKQHPAHEVLDDVLVCSETGAALVAEILEFSRREREAPAPCNLSKLVKGSMRLLKLMAPRNVELHLQLEEVDARVIVHPSQLTQVLLNLAGNAVHATRGRGRITVSVGRVSEDTLANGGRTGDFVELRVADSGEGMDDSVAKKLFEPFFTTKAPGQGTGIGLATVHRIVAELGGWIVVESARGKGTVFRVILPAVSTEQHALNEAGASSEGRPGRPNGHSRRSILVIDPNAEERAKLTSGLTDAGYAVQAFGDHTLAVEVLTTGTDAVAAVLGGFDSPDSASEVARVVRALMPRLPLVLTSFADYARFTQLSEDNSRCAVLARPYRVETLSELFAALIRDESREP